jgi:predicted metal-dependent RNase
MSREIRSQIRKKLDKVDAEVTSLNFERFRIIDYVKEYQEEVELLVRSLASQWEENTR